ncbi:MAG: ATP-dependent DNA helicase [Deltaproteobacteria bacterium]|nr:MAG: ATP-dependent DNA helicase [Deltaproteobacteria bacterium]
MIDLSRVFGPEGMLSRTLPGFEWRPQQLEIAQAVDAAFAAGSNLIVEGPCGSGKSFAYLVPAIFHAVEREKRVVVATANIALQEQLVERDLPLLARAIDLPFRFALVKGRSNYACLQRFYENGREGLLDLGEGEEGVEANAQIERIEAWIEETVTGDRSELPFNPDPGIWRRYAVTGEECPGRSCHLFGECFAVRALEAARCAHIVVCNVHLLLANVNAGGNILPPFDILVCDEAHKLTDVARTFFGARITERAFLRLDPVLRALQRNRLRETLRKAAERYFSALRDHYRKGGHRGRLTEPPPCSGIQLFRLVGDIEGLLKEEIAVAEGKTPPDPLFLTLLKRSLQQARSLRLRLDLLSTMADEGYAYFIEMQGEHPALCARSVAPAEHLRRELFDRLESVVLTSATLATAGSFEFIERETGLEGAETLVVESPFDFGKQALLCIPQGIPEPNDPNFVAAAVPLIRGVVERVQGRALVLFTSYRNMNEVARHLADLPFPVYKQGDLPRSQLLERFRAEVSSVLLGTESFWSGVDCPGETLSCLIIDRLPFPRPDDPVVDLICSRDTAWFTNFSLPRAVIAFKQGVGRLIRARGDRGVVVVLDRRLSTKGYGRAFLASLPPMSVVTDPAALAPFLAAGTGGEPPLTPPSVCATSPPPDATLPGKPRENRSGSPRRRRRHR